MGNLYIDNQSPSNCYFGINPVSAIYIGTNKVWEKSSSSIQYTIFDNGLFSTDVTYSQCYLRGSYVDTFKDSLGDPEYYLREEYGPAVGIGSNSEFYPNNLLEIYSNKIRFNSFAHLADAMRLFSGGIAINLRNIPNIDQYSKVNVILDHITQTQFIEDDDDNGPSYAKIVTKPPIIDSVSVFGNISTNLSTNGMTTKYLEMNNPGIYQYTLSNPQFIRIFGDGVSGDQTTITKIWLTGDET